MNTLELAKGLVWVGVQDPELRVFDIIMHTEFGTTYNSYLLKGEKKTALFETCKLKFWDEYRNKLDAALAGSRLDYLVMNHTEPDHAGTVEKLIERYPGLVIVATGTAVSFLREIVNRDFASLAVGEGDSLDLGGRTLQFMVLPQLHWPDTMYTYVPECKALFTCDSFGSHYSHEGVLRSNVPDEDGYLRATKYYFDNIIGPFRRPYMSNALEHIRDLDIGLICTGHGPVHDCRLDELMALYRDWCAAPAARAGKKVVMPYVSAYGYTAQLAERIAAGVQDAGDITVKRYDMVTADPAEVAGELADADGILLGTPTIIGEALAPIWSLTLGLFAPVHGGKLASAFGSYGWSGEGVPHLIGRLRQLRMRVPDEGFRVRFKPSERQLLDAYEYGYGFGTRLLKQKAELQVLSSRKGGRSLVKCLVCGAIFDSSMESCPVCGVGPDKFVPVEDTATDFRKNTDERFLILGGGPAAHYAAAAIRERNETASIRILTAEDRLPYNRPMLTKVLLQDLSGDRLAIESAAWYAERRIEFCFGTTVQSIDPAAKKVLCTDADGKAAEFAYDKLIYALGARCFVAPIPGADRPHVASIRSASDCEKVQRIIRSRSAKQAVVIGGGVMGLESAWSLRSGGLDVTVLETAPGLLPRQLDDNASALLAELCEKAGVHIVTGAKITEITDDAVLLADGSRFPAQLVIMSTGMRGNIAVGQAAGLDSRILLKIDAHCASSIPDIWVCGDASEFAGTPHGFWSQAAETGRIAGANAAGEALCFEPIGSALSISAMNTGVFSLGTNGKGPDDDPRTLRTVEFRDPQRGNYEKYIFKRGVLAGVILVGDTEKMTEMTKAMEEGAGFAQLFGR